MNMQMLKTELFKIFSKKLIWISMFLFLVLFTVLKIQWYDDTGVKYTLEPVKEELTSAVNNESFHNFVRDSDYSCSLDEMEKYIPTAVFDYIEQFHGNEKITHSLRSDLRNIICNYYERIDVRNNLIVELQEEVSTSEQNTLLRAKKILLHEYQTSKVLIELKLESSANNFIDINHSFVFPGLVMLIIIVGLAGIYSDEYSFGTQSALLTAKKGRNGVFISKLITMIIYVVCVVVIMEAVFFVVTAICYHAPRSTISAASTYGLSLTTYEGSVFGFCMRQVAGTLLAGLTLGSIVMCISAYSKNALIPFFAAGLYYGGTALYANAINFPQYLSILISLPGELSLFMLQTQIELVATGHYTNVFGLIIPTLTVNLIFNVGIMLVCFVLCYRAYTRKQVKD